MACGASSQKTMLWLVFGLIASARSQPVTHDALQEGVGVPEGVPRNEKDLQDLGNSQAFGHMKTIASTLEHVFRQGRDLQDQVEEVTGRQTVATLASSLGDLIRPAITAFVGALTMNSATSVTNAITAALGGNSCVPGSLDVIPAATFMTAPVGRESPVLQPTRESAEEVLKRRPSSRRKQRHPATATYSHTQ